MWSTGCGGVEKGNAETVLQREALKAVHACHVYGFCIPVGPSGGGRAQIERTVQPELGRSREELAPSLRSFPARKYIIFYRPAEDGIEVIRVLSSYRDIDSLLF